MDRSHVAAVSRPLADLIREAREDGCTVWCQRCDLFWDEADLVLSEVEDGYARVCPECGRDDRLTDIEEEEEE